MFLLYGATNLTVNVQEYCKYIYFEFTVVCSRFSLVNVAYISHVYLFVAKTTNISHVNTESLIL